MGFLADKRRINVAVTRARRHLCLVCDSETLSSEPFLEGLVEYAFEHGEVRSAMEFSSEISVVASFENAATEALPGLQADTGAKRPSSAAIEAEIQATTVPIRRNNAPTHKFDATFLSEQLDAALLGAVDFAVEQVRVGTLRWGSVRVARGAPRASAKEEKALERFLESVGMNLDAETATTGAAVVHETVIVPSPSFVIPPQSLSFRAGDESSGSEQVNEQPIFRVTLNANISLPPNLELAWQPSVLLQLHRVRATGVGVGVGVAGEKVGDNRRVLLLLPTWLNARHRALIHEGAEARGLLGHVSIGSKDRKEASSCRLLLLSDRGIEPAELLSTRKAHVSPAQGAQSPPQSLPQMEASNESVKYRGDGARVGVDITTGEGEKEEQQQQQQEEGEENEDGDDKANSTASVQATGDPSAGLKIQAGKKKKKKASKNSKSKADKGQQRPGRSLGGGKTVGSLWAFRHLEVDSEARSRATFLTKVASAKDNEVDELALLDLAVAENAAAAESRKYRVSATAFPDLDKARREEKLRGLLALARTERSAIGARPDSEGPTDERSSKKGSSSGGGTRLKKPPPNFGGGKLGTK